MNRLSNRIALGLTSIGVALPIMIFAPVTTFALVGTTPSTTAKDSPFCTSISTNTGKISSGITDAKSKMNTARTDRATQLTSNRAKWDQEVQANRTKADQQRQENFTKLEAKATTDAQKTAVKTYESTITDAITKRRAANDTARATFRSAVDSAIASQKSTVDAQAAILASAVSTAITTAQAACIATPTNGAAIRTALQASLKTAKDTFNTARKSDGALGDQIKQLATTRNTAIKANDATFEATAKTARETLKAVFGTNTSI